MAIKYVEKLTSILVTESGNPLFYEGKVVEGAKSLTKQSGHKYQWTINQSPQRP